MKRKWLGSDSGGSEKRRFVPPIITDFSSLKGSGAASPEKLSDDSDYDSLFDEDDNPSIPPRAVTSIAGRERIPARCSAPPIPGLYFDPAILIPDETAEQLWKNCMQTYFNDGDINQVMLFERARATAPHVACDTSTNGANVIHCEKASSLPAFLLSLLDILKDLLKDVLPLNVHSLLFPPDQESHKARQVILNHYRPGEGITPHVDLLNRYGDGIIGVSFHSGTVMDFTSVSDTGIQSHLPAESEGELPDITPTSHSIYLPERSVFVLTGEARYKWTHGISRRTEDLVENSRDHSTSVLPRGERLSITFRWLLPGADVVGGCSLQFDASTVWLARIPSC